MEVDTSVSLCCPTVTSSLAHRPDLELLLRIRAKPSRCSGEGGWGGWERRQEILTGMQWSRTTGKLGRKGGDIFLFYNGAVIMLWFDNCAVYIRRSRKTEIKLTFQVSVHLSESRWKVSVPQLASWQRAHAGPPPGDISLRYPFFSASVPEGWLANPPSCLAWQDSEHPFNRQCRFFQRNKSGLFTMFSAWCKTRGEILVFTPLYWRTARASWKWKKDTMQHACSAFFGSTTPLVLYFIYLNCVWYEL